MDGCALVMRPSGLLGQKVSERNDFALLEGIGGECAGAITFLAPGQALPAANRARGF